MKILETLREKGYNLEEDNGIYLNLGEEKIKVKCSYIGKFKDRKLVCIEFTSPRTMSSVENFVKSYARIVNAVYAVISDGEEVKVLDIPSNREVKLDEILPAEKAYEIKYSSKPEIEVRRAAACYSVIHCKCEVER